MAKKRPPTENEPEPELPDLPDEELGAEIPPEDKKLRRELHKAAAAAVRTPEQSRMALRRLVRMFYDLQRLRQQTAGRHLGAAAKDAPEVQLHEADIAILEQRANDLHRAERAALKDIENHLQTIPFYTQVLSNKRRFKGLGPTMSAVILSEFNIVRCDTVSKAWSFAGLKPVPCKRCSKCHTVLKEDKTGKLVHEVAPIQKCDGPHRPYDSARSMRPVKGEKLPYNKFLKTKLVGVMGPCFLKAGSPYRKFYDDYKHRKASMPWGRSDAHRHQAAIRHMVKHFLIDVITEWRQHEGLPVRAPYAEEYLGRVHHG
jgi:hypothetical protein